MTDKTSDKKKSLFDEMRGEHEKAQAEFEKLPPNEQKKLKEGMESLKKKWDQTAFY